jgi:hypothetical protein
MTAVARWQEPRKPTDVELAVTSIHDAKNALENAEMAIENVAEIGERIRAWLDRERTRFPGLTDAEVAVVERLIEDVS